MTRISKYFFIMAAALTGAMVPAGAQTDDSFLDFYRQRTKEFQDWRSKANAEFSDYLAAAWEEFLVQRGT